MKIQTWGVFGQIRGGLLIFILRLTFASSQKTKPNMSEELIPTNLLIGDRSYRVRIHPKDEEVVRKTVKTI